MHTIYVVSLGPGAPELLTLAADKQLHHAKKLVLRTARLRALFAVGRHYLYRFRYAL